LERAIEVEHGAEAATAGDARCVAAEAERETE
jgi:hypothetical protein